MPQISQVYSCDLDEGQLQLAQVFRNQTNESLNVNIYQCAQCSSVYAQVGEAFIEGCFSFEQTG